MKNTAGCLCTLVLTCFALAGHAHATIFGVKSCGSSPPQCGAVPSAAPAQLFSFQEDGSLFTEIGAVQLNGQNIDVDGLALSPDTWACRLRITGDWFAAADNQSDDGGSNCGRTPARQS